MIDIDSFKNWIVDELNAGNRSKASKLNKIFEKYSHGLRLKNNSRPSDILRNPKLTPTVLSKEKE